MGATMTACLQNKVTALFGTAKVRYGDKFVRGVTVMCGHAPCGEEESLLVNHFAGRNSEGDEAELQFITRKLEGRGWKIGNKPDQHRCPKCFAAIKASAARKAQFKNGEPHMTVTPIKSLKDAGQRMLGRDDRRIIFTKLNEVYVGEKIGYGEGWTDERVANDLGVPRAWVKLVRDENFGEEMASEEIRQKLADATKLLDEIKQRTTLAETIVADMKRLTTEAEHMNKSLDAIRKAVGGG
jgi:hypothetical protein